MPIVSANTIDLAYDSFGDASATPMLLIAGLGTQMIRWSDAFCTALAAHGYRVIRFDNRDAGLSTHLTGELAPSFPALAAELAAGRMPAVAYTLHDMARDTIGLMDALKIGKAHVIGRSMGGMIAQIVASDHPDRVLSLTSIMSGTGNPGVSPPAADVMALMTRPAPDPARDEEAFLDHGLVFARRIAGTGSAFDEAATRILLREEMRRAYDPAGSARQLAAVAVAGDRRTKLATIAVPTLVVHGADDPLIPPSSGEDTARSIPGARFMPVEGMGHDLPPPFHAAVIEAIVANAGKAAA